MNGSLCLTMASITPKETKRLLQVGVQAFGYRAGMGCALHNGLFFISVLLTLGHVNIDLYLPYPAWVSSHYFLYLAFRTIDIDTMRIARNTHSGNDAGSQCCSNQVCG